MPFMDGRFVTRSQLLTDESTDKSKEPPFEGPYLSAVRERAYELGYDLIDARLFGNPSCTATWVALLEVHDAGGFRLYPELQAKRDFAIATKKERAKRIRDYHDRVQARKREAKERKREKEAAREAALAASFEEIEVEAKPLAAFGGYWLDNRNGIVLHQKPTAIQEPRFYTRLKDKTAYDSYLAYAALYGKKEAVAVYGNKDLLIGAARTPRSSADTYRDTRQDYKEKENYFTIKECEQFSRPEKWTEKLTRKELLALNCCESRVLEVTKIGGSFVDRLGQRWWKIEECRNLGVYPGKFRFYKPQRMNNGGKAILYCR